MESQEEKDTFETPRLDLAAFLVLKGQVLHGTRMGENRRAQPEVQFVFAGKQVCAGYHDEWEYRNPLVDGPRFVAEMSRLKGIVFRELGKFR